MRTRTLLFLAACSPSPSEPPAPALDVVASFEAPDGRAEVFALHRDADRIVVHRGPYGLDAVESYLLGGAEPTATTVYEPPVLLEALVVLDGEVVRTRQMSTKRTSLVEACSTAGCDAPRVSFETSEPIGIVAGANDVLVVRTLSLVELGDATPDREVTFVLCSTSTCQGARTLVAMPKIRNAHAFRIHEGYVYWAESGGAGSGSPTGRVVRCPLSTGCVADPELVVETVRPSTYDLSGDGVVVLDGVDGAARVVTVGLDGSQRAEIAAAGPENPERVSMTAEHVYVSSMYWLEERARTDGRVTRRFDLDPEEGRFVAQRLGGDGYIYLASYQPTPGKGNVLRAALAD